MAQPRVSVICIFLNEERYLAEAVESILAQDFTDFELLLVDDGSTDGSTAIAKRYAEECRGKIAYLEHPGHENRGMSAARNLGLRHSRGEYLTIMDGDDRWYPHKLREQVAILDADPSVGIACGGYRELGGKGKRAEEWYLSGHVADRPSYPPETTLQVYPLGWSSSPTHPMVRRDVALRVGGFEEQFRGLYEDQAFYAKVFLETGAMFSRSVWLEYRQHENSSTVRQSWDEYVATRLRFLDWFEDYLSTRDVVGKEEIHRAIRKARAKLHNRMLLRVRRRLRHLWLRGIRVIGFDDRFRRDCAAN